MNVVSCWERAPAQSDWSLMIKFYINDRALNSIVKDRAIGAFSDPGKISIIEVFCYLLETDLCMSFLIVIYVNSDQREQSFFPRLV